MRQGVPLQNCAKQCGMAESKCKKEGDACVCSSSQSGALPRPLAFEEPLMMKEMRMPEIKENRMPEIDFKEPEIENMPELPEIDFKEPEIEKMPELPKMDDLEDMRRPPAESMESLFNELMGGAGHLRGNHSNHFEEDFESSMLCSRSSAQIKTLADCADACGMKHGNCKFEGARRCECRSSESSHLHAPEHEASISASIMNSEGEVSGSYSSSAVAIGVGVAGSGLVSIGAAALVLIRARGTNRRSRGAVDESGLTPSSCNVSL